MTGEHGRAPSHTRRGDGVAAARRRSRARRRLTTHRQRRAAAIVSLVAVLVGTGVADRLVGRAAAPAFEATSALAATSVRAAGSESTSWYCEGGTGSQGGAPMAIVLTNGTRHVVTGTASVIPALGASGTSTGPWAGSVELPVAVPAGGQVTLGPAQLGSASFLAVAVVLNGGGVSVAQSASSPLGWSMAPCASSTAPTWYFAHGVTVQGGGLVLSLFNPGATDAAVDVSLFSSTSGFLEPAAYQGIDVPPGSLVTENLGDHAPDDAALGTEVVALTGTIVATELDSVGSAGAGGLSLVLGSPALSSQWVFPQSAGIAGGKVVFHVLNPTTTPVSVTVDIGLTNGAAAEPLSMRIPAQGQTALDTADEIRIPSDAPYALTFTTRRRAIVVSRQVSAPSGLPAPVPEDGDAAGVPGASRRWLVPAAVSPGTGAWSMAIIDVGATATTVHVTTPTGQAVGGVRPQVIKPGVPMLIGPTPGPPFGTAPLVVRADQPVAVELDALPVAGPGVVVIPAFASG